MENIQAFAAHLRVQEKAEATVGKYIRDVRAFQAWSEESGVNSWTREYVIAYKSDLMKRYAVRSVNSIIASLNSFFAFIGRDDLKLRSLKVQREVYCEESRELTKTDYERLCKAALAEGNRRLYLLLQTLGGTGIRVSELHIVASWACVDTHAKNQRIPIHGNPLICLLGRNPQAPFLSDKSDSCAFILNAFENFFSPRLLIFGDRNL